MLDKGLVPDDTTYDILVNGKVKGEKSVSGASVSWMSKFWWFQNSCQLWLNPFTMKCLMSFSMCWKPLQTNGYTLFPRCAWLRKEQIWLCDLFGQSRSDTWARKKEKMPACRKHHSMRIELLELPRMSNYRKVLVRSSSQLMDQAEVRKESLRQRQNCSPVGDITAWGSSCMNCRGWLKLQ